MSGDFTTILTDSPTTSKNYDVEFAACADKDRRNYPIVKIGDQTWMAENLAWLPSVEMVGGHPKYSVYGYMGYSVSEAKATYNYINYGVLYRLDAAETACPDGWHLPSDEEWKVLETNLGMNQSEADSHGGRTFGSVGKKMKSSTGWINNGNGDNSSGLTILPAGFSYRAGDYTPTRLPGEGTRFWSALGQGDLLVWLRGFDFSGDAVERSYSHGELSIRCVKNGLIPPLARFTSDPRSGSPSTLFRFYASGSKDKETKTVDLLVRWDFDGDSIWDTDYDTSKIITHQYASPGSRLVTLEVKNNSGLVDQETKTIVVGEGTLTDSRDGKVYAYKNIGTQTWMIENLAYLPTSGTSWGWSDHTPYYYIYGGGGEWNDNYDIYGTLYNYIAALTACPSGWHLPGNDEWTVLTEYLSNNGYGFEGSGNDIAKALVAPSGWASSAKAGTVGNDQTHSNTSGFMALPGGLWAGNGGFFNLGGSGNFWSSKEDTYLEAWYWSICSGGEGVYNDRRERYSGFSVRCVKDTFAYAGPKATFSFNPTIGNTLTQFHFDASGSTDHQTDTANLQVRWDWNGDGTWDTRFDKIKSLSFQYSDPGVYPVILEIKDSSGLTDSDTINLVVADGTLTDTRDGHTYVYKAFGSQTWMIENLAYLPSVTSSLNKSATTPYYYVYSYEGSNVAEAKITSNYKTYGVLYNWEAAKTACPQGWHLPDKAEQKALTDYLTNNGYGYKGCDICLSKSMASTNGWATYPFTGTVGNDQSSNNRSGFSALPAGKVDTYYGAFNALGYYANFWFASEYDAARGWRLSLAFNDGFISPIPSEKSSSLSVRCLRD